MHFEGVHKPEQACDKNYDLNAIPMRQTVLCRSFIAGPKFSITKCNLNC